MQTVISNNEAHRERAPATWRRLTHHACVWLAVCCALAALGWIAWICWRLVSVFTPGSMSLVDALVVLVALVFGCALAVTVSALCEMGQR